MAKKKVTHQEKPTKNQDQPQIHQTLPMEDPSEKLENLKSLNSMLLKETFERRQQVDSLLLSKGSLESELTRAHSEKEGLQIELTQLSEIIMVLELEKSLALVFVAEQMAQKAEVVERERDEFGREKVEIEKKMECLEREMKLVLREKSDIEKVHNEKEIEVGLLKKALNKIETEIGNERDFSTRVCQEKDEIRAKLDVQIEETNGLRLELIEIERRENVIQEELKNLKIEYNVVVEGKGESERKMDSIMRDKGLIELSLVESNRVIEDMKREIEGITRKKEGVEEERNVEMRKRKELENEVIMLNETLLSLKNDNKRLCGNVGELEKRCAESVEKQKMMEMDINGMVEAKKEMEKRFESLIEEKDLVMKDFNEAVEQLDELKSKMENMVREKIEIEGTKLGLESEIAALKMTEADLRGIILSLEELCKDKQEKIRHLESEVRGYSGEINEVTIERDEARKGFDGEKINGLNLRAKNMEMEKSIEESKKVAGATEAENCKLIGEKKELETRCTMLKKEIDDLDKAIGKARNEFDDTQNKLNFANANSELVLNLLRNTVASLSPKDERNGACDGMLLNGQEVTEEMEPFVSEFEAIKNAFKNRETEVQGMKRELECLQNSVAGAHKQKNIWTLVSSVTTIFAAVSVAYVARAH